MQQIRALAFEERPDYDSFRQIFKELFYRSGFEYDYNYDWMKKQRSDRLRQSNKIIFNNSAALNQPEQHQ